MKRLTKSVIVAVATVNLAGAAIAQENHLSTNDKINQATIPQAQFHETASADDSLFDSEAMTESKLQAIAGREDITQISQADQTAEVSRNSVGDNSITGSSRVDGNAFQNMSGLSILNVNTGNNVAINASMNVNISINPSQ